MNCHPAAVLAVAVDEVRVGVVIEGDDDLRVLSLVVLGVVFDVTASGLVECKLAVAVPVAVGVDDGGGGVLGCGRDNGPLILRGRTLVDLKMGRNVILARGTMLMDDLNIINIFPKLLWYG